MLYAKNGKPADVVIRGARVLDPTERIDAVLHVRVDGGTIAALGSRARHQLRTAWSTARGLVLAPAFVDPHVHLRSPGREDEETIASGTAAAAAGGYCAILAMPNTDPVVDSAAVLGSLIEHAEADAVVPVGFLAAITRGQQGRELTEMGELAAAGAAGFTDDGMPIVAAGLMRRALQYNAITGLRLALHCEEPTLSRGGHMHEGSVSAELGFTGYPSVAESLMVERDLALAAYEHQAVHLMHLSARESVAALSRAHAAGIAATGEVTPHHLCLTDDAVRSLDSNVKMNPPLRSEDDRQALIDGLPRRDDLLRRHRPRAARAAREGRAVRGRAVRRHRPGDRVRRALHRARRDRRDPARHAARAHVQRAGASLRAGGAADRGRRSGEPHAHRHRRQLAGRREQVPLAIGQLVAARPDAAGQGAAHGGRRPPGVRMTGFLALEDGTVFPGEPVGAPGFAFGEAVFTTAMTGYQEIVTDPSFAEQIVCFTSPMIGNYGVARERSESGRAQARAVIVREARGPAWTDWLHDRGVVALSGVDTRSLVLHLRERGAMRAVAVAGESTVAEAVEACREQPAMAGRALAGEVSTKSAYEHSDSRHGADRGARLRCYKRSIPAPPGDPAGAAVTVFPARRHGAGRPHGLRRGALLSNGPGDPEPLVRETEVVRELLGLVPVLGICLGHQLLARAAGMDTYKLPFGHRGANHPVHDRAGDRVLVTAQNHGFAVAATEGEEATHVSLYDGTVEGLAFPDLRARSVQFHPEAGPGPHDAWPILESWVEEVSVLAAA